MLIFANEISKDNAEEIFFHENIHAILDEWYGDTLRGIAERFWEIAPDDGKVSKDYIKRYYPEEKQKEELFTCWLARSMRDGDVDAMMSMFDDVGDIARINTILNTFGYVKGRETNERRRFGNPDRVQGTQGEVGKEVAEKSDIKGGCHMMQKDEKQEKEQQEEKQPDLNQEPKKKSLSEKIISHLERFP